MTHAVYRARNVLDLRFCGHGGRLGYKKGDGAALRRLFASPISTAEVRLGTVTWVWRVCLIWRHVASRPPRLQHTRSSSVSTQGASFSSFLLLLLHTWTRTYSCSCTLFLFPPPLFSALQFLHLFPLTAIFFPLYLHTPPLLLQLHIPPPIGSFFRSVTAYHSLVISQSTQSYQIGKFRKARRRRR